MLPLASLFSGCTSLHAFAFAVPSVRNLIPPGKEMAAPNSWVLLKNYFLSEVSPNYPLLNIKINFFAYASCSLPASLGISYHLTDRIFCVYYLPHSLS